MATKPTGGRLGFVVTAKRKDVLALVSKVTKPFSSVADCRLYTLLIMQKAENKPYQMT